MSSTWQSIHPAPPATTGRPEGVRSVFTFANEPSTMLSATPFMPLARNETANRIDRRTLAKVRLSSDNAKATSAGLNDVCISHVPNIRWSFPSGVFVPTTYAPYGIIWRTFFFAFLSTVPPLRAIASVSNEGPRFEPFPGTWHGESRLLRKATLALSRTSSTIETACEAWSDSRVSLSISEQSIVFPMRENLENQNQSASSRSGLDRVDAAVRESQFKAPSVRERRRKATTRRELRRNPILRNLVPSENFLLQARDPPLK